ncbi:MAG: hypothetical protein AAFR38_05550 [Planctomycetota bacterium]
MNRSRRRWPLIAAIPLVLAWGCGPRVEVVEGGAWPAEWESLRLYSGKQAGLRAYSAGDVNAGRAISLGKSVNKDVDRAVRRAGDKAKPIESEPIDGGVSLVVVLGKDDPTPEPFRRVIEEEVVTIKEQIAKKLSARSVLMVAETAPNAEADADEAELKVAETEEEIALAREKATQQIAEERFKKPWNELTDEQRNQAIADYDLALESANAERAKIRDVLLDVLDPELLEQLMPLGLTREQAIDVFPESVSRDVRWVMIRPSPERAWQGLEPVGHRMIEELIDNPLFRAAAHVLLPVFRGTILDKYADVVALAAQSLELRARGIDAESVGVEDPFRDWVEASGKADGERIFGDDTDEAATEPAIESGDTD